jgi:hypothetical protein
MARCHMVASGFAMILLVIKKNISTEGFKKISFIQPPEE